MKCPNCGCPFSSAYGEATADVPRAWQDTDGVWYKGPARRSMTEQCDNCGRTVVREWRRGKLVKEDVTAAGVDPAGTA